MAVIIKEIGKTIQLTSYPKQIVLSATLGGVSDPVYYEFMQAAPASQWTINHNLGFFPQTQVFSAGGVKLEADILNVSPNQTIVSHKSPIAGYARLN